MLNNRRVEGHFRASSWSLGSFERLAGSSMCSSIIMPHINLMLISGG